MNLTIPFFSRGAEQQPTMHDRVNTFSPFWLLVYNIVTLTVAIGASGIIFYYQYQNIEGMQLNASESLLRKVVAFFLENAKIVLFILGSVFFAVKGGKKAKILGILLWLFGTVVIFNARFGMIEKNHTAAIKDRDSISSIQTRITEKKENAKQSQAMQEKANTSAAELSNKGVKLALTESWRPKGSPPPSTSSHDIIVSSNNFTAEAKKHGDDARAAKIEADKLQLELDKMLKSAKPIPTEVSSFGGMQGARYAAMFEGLLISFVDMLLWDFFGVGVAVLSVRRGNSINKTKDKGFFLKLMEIIWNFTTWAILGVVSWVANVVMWAFSFITPPTPAKKTPSSPPTLPDFLQPEAPTPESVKLIAQVPATAEVKPVVTAANDETKALKQPDTPLIEQPESAPATPAIESVAPAAPAAPAKQPNAAKPKAKIVTAAQQTQGKSMRDLMANAAFVGVALGAAGAPTSIAHAAPVNQESSPPTQEGSPPTLFGDASAEELQFNQITEMVRNKGFSPSVANLKKHMKCGDVPATKMRNRLLCERIVMMNKEGNGYVVIRDL